MPAASTRRLAHTPLHTVGRFATISAGHNHNVQRTSPAQVGLSVRSADEYYDTTRCNATQSLTVAHTPGYPSNRLSTRSKGKGSPYSITERRVPELIPVLGSQPAGDVSHKSGGRLPLLSARPTVTLATLMRAATNFAAW